MKDLGLLRWFLGMQIDHGITAGTLKKSAKALHTEHPQAL
jgi:hypothetical protein